MAIIDIKDSKLKNEELENIVGGLIVHSTSSGYNRYCVVDENKGGVFLTQSNTEQRAREIARSKGLSEEVISVEEYRARFNPDDPEVW